MKCRKIIMFALILTLLSANITYSTSLDDLSGEKAEISSSIKENEASLEKSKAEAAKVEVELAQLESELQEAVDKLNKVTELLNNLTDKLEKSEEELIISIEKRDAQEIVLQKRLRYMYEYGNVSYLQIILTSTSFVDFINRAEYIKKIAEFDQNAFDVLQEYSLEVERKTREIAAERLEVEKQQKNELQARDEVQSKVNAKVQLFERIKNDIYLFEQTQEKLEAASKEIENMIKAEEERLASIARAANQQQSEYTGGQLLWPVPSNSRISSHYGYRTHPVTGEKYKLHAGMDVPASMGTPVVASADGTVISSGYNGGYGYAVVISHGGGLSTLYAHNSTLYVKAGESVTRGQQIALSGNTGLSTGPHVHFEVRVNGTPKDPINYLR